MNESVYYRYWLPINASAHGAPIDSLINIIHYFMLVLFVGWGVFLLYCLVKFRSRPGHQPTADSRHFLLPKYLEIGVAIIEIVLLVFLSQPIWAKVKNEFPDPNTSLHIRIIAEQFAWNFHYPGKDGIFGKTDRSLIDGTNTVGLDRSDPAAADDIVSINNLHIPVNKPVTAELSSKDVIHSFSLPVMRVKQDAIPGTIIPIWFEANQTGEFDVVCAQLCGIGHYRMKGALFIDTVEQYDTWVAEEEKALAESAG